MQPQEKSSTGNRGVGVPPPAAGEMAATVARIRATARHHSTRFEHAIPLIASENLLSPYAKELLISDLHSRYAEGLPGERYYEGNEDVDTIERTCLELARRLFRCSFADVRPISGTVANLAVLKALAEPGDLVGTSRLADGAHISSAAFGAFGLRGVKPVYYAWDPEADDDRRRPNPGDPSRRPTEDLPVRALAVPLPDADRGAPADARGDRRARMVRRERTSSGLIAGGQFQDPLQEGCTVMSRLHPQDPPRPAARDPARRTRRTPSVKKRLESGAFPGVTSNHHLHSMAALAVSLAEHLEFGRDYARQTIANARALAQALHDRGFDVLAAEPRVHPLPHSRRARREGGGRGGGRETARRPRDHHEQEPAPRRQEPEAPRRDAGSARPR